MTPEEAVELAKEAHKDQTDFAGEPYIHHVLRVAQQMKMPRHQMLAILHDVLEDSMFTEDYLIKAGVPLDAVFTLGRLTRKKGQSYDEYIDGMLSDIDAIVVKIADLRDNMDVTRLPVLGENECKRLQKYHKAHRRLMAALGELYARKTDEEKRMEASNDGTKH
jgi:(p)ppGpp synthase/HD superfamily hydrolase